MSSIRKDWLHKEHLLEDEVPREPQTLLVNGNFNVNNHAHIIKGVNNLTSWFYWFFAHRDLTPYLTRQGASRYKLTKAVLSQLPCVLPPVGEQRAIATALSDVDALLDGLTRLIAKKRDLKQATMQQLLTGQTRLPGFSGSWDLKTLGDVVERFVGGGTPSRAISEYWGNEIPWVTVKDFATFDPFQAQESITKLGVLNSATTVIPAGTLITSTRMALGKAVAYKVDVAINQDLKALFVKQSVRVDYLLHWFAQNGEFIDSLGGGSTVKGISVSELKRLPVLLPATEEQTAIAAILSDMDAELSALEARLTKTRALKQAMMQELLTGKIRLISPEAVHA